MSAIEPVKLSAVPGLGQPTLADLRDAEGRWLRPVVAPVDGARRTLVGSEARIGVIDSGVATQHPTIATALATAPLDVTGEGVEDEIGHGTCVALAVLAQAPSVQLVSIKAVGASGLGDRPSLLRALQVAFEEGVDTLNLSLGSYDPDCVGKCFLCSAVGNLAAAGVIVVAAAGNVPGRTDCPAKAGLFNGTAFSIAAMDAETGKTAWYSGVGEFLFPPAQFKMEPVE